MIKNYKNLTEDELDLAVCRYLTFPKFMNMLAYSAIWFSKLNILQDQFEGLMPTQAKVKMLADNQKWKQIFPENLHPQIDSMAARNEQDGRELLVINCWYLGKADSPKMWKEYCGGSTGIAINSTIRKLSQYIYTWPEYSHIGKVQYVDFDTHEMAPYEANQAHERAFLKSQKYSGENEIRIVTMNFKHPRCVSMEGEPYTQEQCSGKNMNNFENPGLYIGIDFGSLVDSIVLVPGSPDWVKNTINKIFKMSHLVTSIN
ncbi:MAG: hypothetical protein ACE5HX_17020 [bacterium]